MNINPVMPQIQQGFTSNKEQEPKKLKYAKDTLLENNLKTRATIQADKLTKALRNKGDIVGILEELADVSLGIDYVKEIFDITDKELEYARSIKMTELYKKLSGESSEDYI